MLFSPLLIYAYDATTRISTMFIYINPCIYEYQVLCRLYVRDKVSL